MTHGPDADASSYEDPKVNFSGLVVTLNDDTYLSDCLTSLMFCDDITVTDMQSVDRSREIAEEVGATVVVREPVPVVEHALADVVNLPEHDWIFRLDPDEVCPPTLAEQVVAVANESIDIGKIELPVQFYFCGRPLRGTVWGPPKWFARVFNRTRVEISPYVHRGLENLPGYQTHRIAYTDDNALAHFWVDTISELIEKHRRYITQEGASLADQGKRFTWFRLAYDPCRAFLYSFFVRRGWRDGWRGLFLSAFHAWYVAKSMLALRQHLIGK